MLYQYSGYFSLDFLPIPLYSLYAFSLYFLITFHSPRLFLLSLSALSLCFFSISFSTFFTFLSFLTLFSLSNSHYFFCVAYSLSYLHFHILFPYSVFSLYVCLHYLMYLSSSSLFLHLYFIIFIHHFSLLSLSIFSNLLTRCSLSTFYLRFFTLLLNFTSKEIEP